ncbi:MAG: hypothetical protein AB7G93_16030 [Bdellovibrionales bacterium]
MDFKKVNNNKGFGTLLVCLMVGMSALLTFHTVLASTTQHLKGSRLARTVRNDLHSHAIEAAMVLSDPSSCQNALSGLEISRVSPTVSNVRLRYPHTPGPHTPNILAQPGMRYSRVLITEVELTMAPDEFAKPIEGAHVVTLQVKGRVAVESSGNVVREYQIPIHIVTDAGGRITACRGTSYDRDKTLERSVCATRAYDPIANRCI